MSKPEPVQEHYVRKLLAMSSCFMDGQGSLVCFSEPCACAKTLLDEIGRPLRAEVERLRTALEAARHGIMGHFDDNCSDCRETLAVIDAALERKP
jgi:hypothetical protein